MPLLDGRRSCEAMQSAGSKPAPGQALRPCSNRIPRCTPVQGTVQSTASVPAPSLRTHNLTTRSAAATSSSFAPPRKFVIARYHQRLPFRSQLVEHRSQSQNALPAQPVCSVRGLKSQDEYILLIASWKYEPDIDARTRWIPASAS